MVSIECRVPLRSALTNGPELLERRRCVVDSSPTEYGEPGASRSGCWGCPAIQCACRFVETASTIGLPRYAKQAVDQQSARWVMSNPLPT